MLALVLGDRPLRTGLFFYIGALTATLAVGVAAAFVLGDLAASETPSEPKTWVAILDVIAVLLAGLGDSALAEPSRSQKQEGMNQMGKVASSPAIAVVGPAPLSPTQAPSYRSP